MQKSNDLVKYITHFWPQSIGQNITIGLSGGIDSVVLLHALSQIALSKPLQLTAIHINHGISPNADSWVNFCQKLCANLNINLTIKYLTLVKSGGESLENIARKARYEAFSTCESGIIAIAHHQDDQVETTLSQLFRGSDLHNIAAMHSTSIKNNKIIWRPLLGISKKQIENYANKYNLRYIIDESNHDTKYLRNFIRHEVVPLMVGWDGHIKTKILNFNQQLQNMLSLTDEIAEIDLRSCYIATSTTSHSRLNDTNTKQNNILCMDSKSRNISTLEISIIDLNKFKLLSTPRQLNLIAYFIKKCNIPLPSHKQLIEFIRQATTSAYDKTPQLKLGPHYHISKYKNQITIQLVTS